MPEKIAVFGAGSWGTALAILLGRKGYRTVLWARSEENARRINEERRNCRYLGDVEIPEQVRVTGNLEEAATGAEVVMLSVPSHVVREITRAVCPFLTETTTVINTAKGLEGDSLLTLSQVIAEEVPARLRERIAVLSGPSHAEEVCREMPTTAVIASHQPLLGEYIQDIFISPFFRVYTNPDVIGVELGGAMKNIIALATGIAEGLGLGDNAKAALMTRGLNEIARLGMRMGANPLTFAGLSGLGDLIVTCTSVYSRNRKAGIGLGKGEPLNEVLEKMGMVVEGVGTTGAACRLAVQKGVEMPITQQVYRVLFEGESPRKGVANLMERGPTHEVEEVALNWETLHKR